VLDERHPQHDKGTCRSSETATQGTRRKKRTKSQGPFFEPAGRAHVRNVLYDLTRPTSLRAYERIGRNRRKNRHHSQGWVSWCSLSPLRWLARPAIARRLAQVLLCQLYAFFLSPSLRAMRSPPHLAGMVLSRVCFLRKRHAGDRGFFFFSPHKRRLLCAAQVGVL
jgi:hypothetical protein